MSGSGVPCRAQDGGLQQLLDRIQTVRIRRRIGDLDLAAFDGKSFGFSGGSQTARYQPPPAFLCFESDPCTEWSRIFPLYQTDGKQGLPGLRENPQGRIEQFIFMAMQEKFKDFQFLHGKEEKANPKLTAYQVELAQVEAEIEKLLDTLTGANATLLAYANKKIEELDTRRQTISKAIAELSVETISPQQIKKLSYYLDNWNSIDFDDKRKAADILILTIRATSDRVQIEWKI